MAPLEAWWRSASPPAGGTGPGAYWLNLEGQAKTLDQMPNSHTFSVLLGPADFTVEILLSACVVIATTFLALEVAA